MTTTTTTIEPPLKWHGGKHYLARRIIALMPPHLHYVEPFFGGGSVLLAKDPDGVSEVANDLNGELTNFWAVLRDTERFADLLRYLESQPFCEKDWNDAEDVLKYANGTVRAAAFFVRCRQSLAGRMDTFAPLSRTRTRRGMNEQASAWITAVDGLPAVHARLRRVAILNRPAVEVIRSQDGPDTLFYCDPPYVHGSRSTTGEYAHEMTDADHRELAAALRACKGKVLISGYPSALYDELFAGWRTATFDLPNNSAGGKSKERKTETVWMNYGG